MACNRRRFLQTAGLAGVGVPLNLFCSKAFAKEGAVRPADSAMGVLVDLTKCNGCRRCEAACSEANGFPIPSEEALKDKSTFSAVRVLGPRQLTTVNEYRVPCDGDERPVYVKTNCMHCVDAACASACIVGAMQKQPEGAVTYDPDKCMGCRYCMVACPFDVPTYEYDNAFTPEVRKCSFCFATNAVGELEVPACVRACPKECLTFGRRAELLSRAREKIRQHPEVYTNRVYGEYEAGGTSWLYLSHVPFEKLGFPAIPADATPRLSESIQHGVFAYFVPPIAWCATLALTMWLTGSRPSEQRSREKAHESAPTGHSS